MENKDRPVFAAAIGALMELHGKTPSESMLDLYWESLKQLSVNDFKVAIGKVARECKFMPKPVEIIEAIERSTKITAAMQWAHVRNMMYKIDIYGSPDFGPLVNAVLHALGGWKVLCWKSLPDLVWYQKDFERLYTEFGAKDLSGLRTDGHVGEFGKPPTWCALEGTQKPPTMLPSGPANGVSAIVRALAESKSLEHTEEAK